MKCCENQKLLSVIAKCSDRCSLHLQGHNEEYDGYVPGDLGIGGGDYINFDYCINCGKIQGNWPIKLMDETDPFGTKFNAEYR